MVVKVRHGVGCWLAFDFSRWTLTAVQLSVRATPALPPSLPPFPPTSENKSAWARLCGREKRRKINPMKTASTNIETKICNVTTMVGAVHSPKYMSFAPKPTVA